MRAGRLRDKITIKDFTNTPNPDGTPNESWSDLFSIRGNVVWMRGSSFLENYQYLYNIEGRAFVRYREDIKPEYRLSINSNDYDIESIKPVDNKKREMEIMFKAVEI